MKKFPLLSATIVLSAGVFGFLPLAHAQSACDFSNNFACPSGQTCNSGTCVATPQAPAQTASPGSGSSGGGSSGTGFTALAPIPGLTQGAVANSTGLAQFLNNLYKYLVGLAATLAVIEIIIGGLQISTESVTKKSVGKQRITQALLGLVLVLSPALVFGIINPSILNLSVNIPPLKTAWGHWAPPAPGTNITGKNCSNIGACVARAEDQCTAQGAGFKPVLTPNGQGGFTVTCSPPLPPSGSAVTAAQCMAEPGYQPGNMQQGTSVTCDSAQALIKKGGYVCNALSGGGICLHNK